MVFLFHSVLRLNCKVVVRMVVHFHMEVELVVHFHKAIDLVVHFHTEVDLVVHFHTEVDPFRKMVVLVGMAVDTDPELAFQRVVAIVIVQFVDLQTLA
ncbi:hypothetical protein BC833DRAFT_612595 [Globomyces pollinis-pini]|nr:hypothetical protein BC833DRAFT_612595 [Globomyces pollinis-pini]